jgi:hypothetical protein
MALLMKRSALFSILVAALCSGTTLRAQTTATDFTANDCSGVSHHLFSELDAGKVIVAVFVMPCSGCIIPANDAQNVVESYVATHPGKVEMFLVDDDALTPCATLQSWRNANGLHLMPTFSDPSFVQSQYGTPAMPKIVVMGGPDHLIYDIQDNAVDIPKLGNSIDVALGIATGVQSTKVAAANFSVFPNPASGSFSVSLTAEAHSAADIELIDVSGKVVSSKFVSLKKGGNTFDVSIAGQAPGLYTVKLSNGDADYESKLLVK